MMCADKNRRDQKWLTINRIIHHAEAQSQMRKCKN